VLFAASPPSGLPFATFLFTLAFLIESLASLSSSGADVPVSNEENASVATIEHGGELISFGV
jgi:hypothetical protein